MTIGHEVRNIVRSARSSSLATLDHTSSGPYVSLVTHACDVMGRPVFLLSDLSDHTQNAKHNPNVSLLCDQARHLANPQAGPRVSLVGKLETCEKNEAMKTMFLARQPKANVYCDFTDFNFYRMRIRRAHYVGGFGRAIWLESEEYLCDSAEILDCNVFQSEICVEIYKKYPQFLNICVTKLQNKPSDDLKIIRIDPDGLDLVNGGQILRYPFEKEVKTMGTMHNLISKTLEQNPS